MHPHTGTCACTGVFTTKSQYRKANKKRDKLARRACRVAAGGKQGQQHRQGSESPAAPMITEMSFVFGNFEQHTTGEPLDGWFMVILRSIMLQTSCDHFPICDLRTSDHEVAAAISRLQ